MSLVNQPTYQLLGHRGARAEWLENSKLGFAFTQTLAPQLNGVEFDVQLTADNQLVVVHDEDLQRLAGLQSKVREKTLVQLQAITQSDWGKFANGHNLNFLSQPILTLAELLPFLIGFSHIELEVKTHKATDYQTLAKAIFEIVKNPTWHNLPITITSFDTDFLVVWQNRFQSKLPFRTGLLLETKATLASEITFFPTTISQIYEVCNLACQLGCTQVGVYFGLITPDLIAITHWYGLKVTAWTVNDIDKARQLIDWQVDTIITDYPSKFLAEL